ncbi:MAG: hypothetical protein LBM98_07290 [Oscillospiraceae bacterium]|jgi:hypothetical protein|nr:hypothetical protein [Oscillospiraceae bacterium]
MRKFSDYLAEQLKDPEFRKEYDALEDWGKQIQAQIDARLAREASRRKPKISAESIRVKASL